MLGQTANWIPRSLARCSPLLNKAPHPYSALTILSSSLLSTHLFSLSFSSASSPLLVQISTSHQLADVPPVPPKSCRRHPPPASRRPPPFWSTPKPAIHAYVCGLVKRPPTTKHSTETNGITSPAALPRLRATSTVPQRFPCLASRSCLVPLLHNPRVALLL